MAKKPKSTIYAVTIAGEYFAAVTNGNELRPYEVTVNMSEAHKQAGFLSTFKNLVAARVMPIQYPNYGGGLASHRIISVFDTANPDAIINDPTLMTLPQLVAFIEKNGLPVTLALYKDEDDLKQAVVDCLEDEETFIEAQDKRQDLRGADIALANELAELNPGLHTVATTPTSAVAESKKVDISKVPDAAEVEVPVKPVKVKEDTDRVTVDTTKGKSTTVQDDLEL